MGSGSHGSKIDEFPETIGTHANGVTVNDYRYWYWQKIDRNQLDWQIKNKSHTKQELERIEQIFNLHTVVDFRLHTPTK